MIATDLVWTKACVLLYLNQYHIRVDTILVLAVHAGVKEGSKPIELKSLFGEREQTKIYK